MAAVDQSVLIDAYVRWGKKHGRHKLEELWEETMAKVNDGLLVTSLTFEGANGSSQQIKIDPSELLVVLEQALQVMDDDVDSRATHILFGGSILEV